MRDTINGVDTVDTVPGRGIVGLIAPMTDNHFRACSSLHRLVPEYDLSLIQNIVSGRVCLYRANYKAHRQTRLSVGTHCMS